jgi:glutamate-1-semialdehyde 2,1-aminomutase
MSDQLSRALFERAQKRIPGGVNSPVRAFKSVGGDPVFIKSASGCMLTGADDRRYIDYVGSWGPMILGHANPAVVAAICDAALKGSSYGAPTEAEVQLAELLCDAIESLQMVRLTSTGTEACMSALRVARGFTKRNMVLKFEGCYHGHADQLLVKAGSGGATFGVPDSAGVPETVARNTLTARFNDLASVTALFDLYPDAIAAVIVEPVVGNMGCVPPEPGFLQALNELCEARGAVLVLDEVMTGFRLAYGGAQAIYGVRPALTTLAKIVGGGVPLGAFGGRRELLSLLAPIGPVYQAGTLSGNPLSTAAGLATLKQLQNPSVYAQLERTGERLQAGFTAAAKAHGVPVTVQRVGSMWTVFFTDHPVKSWDDAAKCDTQRFGRWHRAMLERGVYLPPSQFEAAFHSLAHDDEAVESTVRAAHEAFKTIA